MHLAVCRNRAAPLYSEVCSALTGCEDSSRRLDMKLSTLLDSKLYHL